MEGRSFTRKSMFLVGIMFIAFNLRPAITSVGPLVGSIRNNLGISNGAAGLITTLPLISFAIFSLLAPKLGSRFGNEWTVFAGLLILMAGILIRSAGWTAALFGGTSMVGVGIAIGNVLLPSLVKQKYPKKMGIMTSRYSTAMNVFAALASGISIPLATGLHLGWDNSLLFWTIPALLAAVIWLPQLRSREKQPHAKELPQAEIRLWFSGIAWQVTVFMGLQSFLFYSFIAWMPEILHSYGMSGSTAGWMLSVTQFAGLPATFLAPVLAERFRDQRGIVAGIGILYFIGIAGLLAEGSLVILSICIVFIGIGQGASISLSLTLLGLRSANARQAAALSGMAQSVGYLLAAAGPILIGFIFDHTHSWLWPILVLTGVLIVMVTAGLGAGRNRYVLGAKKKDSVTYSSL